MCSKESYGERAEKGRHTLGQTVLGEGERWLAAFLLECGVLGNQGLRSQVTYSLLSGYTMTESYQPYSWSMGEHTSYAACLREGTALQQEVMAEVLNP